MQITVASSLYLLSQGRFAMSAGNQRCSCRSVPFLRLAAFAVIAVTAFAQTQTGSISGTITDPNGAVVPGVTVDATSQSAGTTMHVVSSDAGLYVFPSLTTGLWTITAQKTGFKKLVRTDIEV